jgi:RecA-family ATPase
MREWIVDGAISRQLAKPQAIMMKSFIDMQFPPREYLMKPWLTTTGLAMIDAQAGHGKTWLALCIAYAVATGQSLLGWEALRKARVLYVDGELPGALLQDRLQKLGPPTNNLIVLARSQFELRDIPMLDLGTEEGREYLDGEIERHGVELIILDSISTLIMSGEENPAEEWRPIQEWSLTHRGKGRAMIWLHHHGASGQPRGTTMRLVVLDSRLRLARDLKLCTDTETAFELDYGKPREFFGADMQPMMAYFSTQSGIAQWRREAVKPKDDAKRERAAAAELKKGRVLELRKAKWSYTAIATELHISKGRVSQIVKEAGENTRE